MMKFLRDEPVWTQAAVQIIATLAATLGFHLTVDQLGALNLFVLLVGAIVTRRFTRAKANSIPVPSVIVGSHGPEPITASTPRAAVIPAQSPKERLPMNIGNWFDSIFKKPWLDVVHGVEHSPETLALQAKAEADIAAAKDAVATAVASHEAAAQASVSGVVDNALNAGLSHIPVIGPLITGEADAVANNFTDNAIHSLIGKLEGFLSPGFNAPAI